MAYNRHQYRWFFQVADADQDGYLNYKEFKSALTNFHYTGPETDIKRMFHGADLDCDNKISYSEYLIAMGQKAEPDYAHASVLRRIFALFDKDGSGEIDKKELNSVFKELGKNISDEDSKRLMELADKDNSGTLNYEEFITALVQAEDTSLTGQQKEKKEPKK